MDGGANASSRSQGLSRTAPLVSPSKKGTISKRLQPAIYGLTAPRSRFIDLVDPGLRQSFPQIRRDDRDAILR